MEEGWILKDKEIKLQGEKWNLQKEGKLHRDEKK